MPTPTILGYIVPLLTVQLENAATHCLFYMLSTYDVVAASLLRHVQEIHADIPEPLEFRTWVAWEYGGIPDMGGLHDDSPVLLIECKFWAYLTDHQPKDYIPQLPPDSAGLLLFLAPGARLESLWTELTERCAAASIGLGPREDHGDSWISAAISEHRRLAVSSWERLLAHMRSGLDANGNLQALAELDQLEGLCTRLIMGDPGCPKFGIGEALRNMVDAISQNLVARDLAVIRGYRAAAGPGNYFRYLTLAGHTNWAVVYFLEPWQRFGDSMLWLARWLGPECEDALDALDAAFPGRARRMAGYYLLPLLCAAGETGPEALWRLTEQAAEAALVLQKVKP